MYSCRIVCRCQRKLHLTLSWSKWDIWWPRQGVFPYSFAPKSTFPRHIRFEAQLNGRYYETFADDSEYEIGRITVWGSAGDTMLHLAGPHLAKP